MKTQIIRLEIIIFLVTVPMINGIAKDNIVLRRSFIKGIPVLEYFADGCPKYDLVILSHGFTGKKENWIERMKQLARMGFYTIALDNRYHGERIGATFNEKIVVNGKLDLLELRKAMSETASDVSVLIDHYSSTGKFDKIGMIGISMGGFITYASLVNDKRISFIVPIISSPFWDDIPKGIEIRDTKDAIREFKDYAISNSPANQFEKFYSKQMFSLIGTNDEHFEVRKVLDFYEKLESIFPDDIRINIYDVGHEVNEAMWNDVLIWLSNIKNSNRLNREELISISSLTKRITK